MKLSDIILITSDMAKIIDYDEQKFCNTVVRIYNNGYYFYSRYSKYDFLNLSHKTFDNFEESIRQIKIWKDKLERLKAFI